MVDNKKQEPAYIFESPDGGKTVFRHEFGKPETKELIKVGDDDLDIIDDHYQDWIEVYDPGTLHQPAWSWTTDNDSIVDDEEWERSFKQEVTWKDIKQQAETHPALKNAMEQMLTLYNLSKEHKEDDDDVPF